MDTDIVGLENLNNSVCPASFEEACSSGKVSFTLLLRTCLSVKEYKWIAQCLLLANAELINKIIQEARRLEHLPGGEELISLLQGLRYILGEIKPQFKDRTIKRALRRSHPTLCTEPSWEKRRNKM